MKYARCPKCNGRLGIPNKKRGRSVKCPKCDTEFVAPDHLDNDSGELPKQKSSKNGATKKPSIRSLPIPGAIAETPAVPTVVTSSAPSTADPMMPPSKRLGVMSPSGKSNPATPVQIDGPPSPPGSNAIPVAKPSKRLSSLDAPKPAALPVEPMTPVSDVPIPRAIPTAKASPKPVPQEAKPAARSVARIIKTESVAPQLTKDGKLPTLQLTDDPDEKPKDDVKTNPVLLTAVICGSLLMSAMMLFMLGGGDTDRRAKEIQEAKDVVRTFYEIRPDQELKPYQRELRKAQLAHSRQDYDIEIRAYESVMGRLNSEELTEYSGVTGTASSDLQLRKFVSILLTEAKRKRR